MREESTESPQFTPERLASFLSWLESNDFHLSPKLEIRSSGALSNMGTFAKAAIAAGELLFSVPRDLLISAASCSLGPLLASSAEALGSASGWLPLILTVMQERLVEPSRWRPYLRVAPNFGEHRLPLQWDKEDRERLLKGTGLAEEVEADLRKMEEEWREVLIPFVKKNKEVFTAPEFQDFGFFKDTVAFIIAYSFSEPDEESEDEEENEEEKETKKPPFLVPMADMLNHSPCNNAEVQYKPDRLEVRAILDIAAGTEIFNTYGELSNDELLRNHGFALPPTDLREAGVDTVPVPLATDLPPERRQLLCEAGFLEEGERAEAVFGSEGFVNADFAGLLLAVAAMPEEELEARRNDPDLTEGAWLAALEEEDEAARDFLGCRAQFRRLPASWGRLLRAAATRQLAALPPPETEVAGRSQRDVFAARVRESHSQLLQLLLTSLPPA